MKINYFISIIFLLSIISCNDIMEDSQMTEFSYLHKEQADKRSYEEALHIAQQSISMLDDSLAPTRGTTQVRYIDLQKTTAIVCSNDMVTRSSGSPKNDTLMYVFNFNDNQGFAIVSAEEATEGLIAITESGSYNPSDTTDSGFNRFIGTGANMADIRDALISYGYSVGDVTSYQYLANTTTIENHLSDGKIILMTGKNYLGEGHAWVIDGFYRYTVHYRWYEYTPNNELPDYPLLTLINEQYNQYRYNHINWGYDGFNNGFFSDGVFSYYGNAYSYDSSNYIQTTNNNNLKAEYNFSVNVNFITIYKD